MKLANTAAADAVAPIAWMQTHIVAASNRTIANCHAVARPRTRGLRLALLLTGVLALGLALGYFLATSLGEETP